MDMLVEARRTWGLHQQNPLAPIKDLGQRNDRDPRITRTVKVQADQQESWILRAQDRYRLFCCLPDGGGSRHGKLRVEHQRAGHLLNARAAREHGAVRGQRFVQAVWQCCSVPARRGNLIPQGCQSQVRPAKVADAAGRGVDGGKKKMRRVVDGGHANNNFPAVSAANRCLRPHIRGIRPVKTWR